MSTHIFRGIQKLYTFSGLVEKAGRKPHVDDLTVIANAAMIVQDGRVIWVGPEKKVKSELIHFQNLRLESKSSGHKSRIGLKTTRTKVQSVDLNAKTVLPGFVEGHTHLLFAGDRRHEFELRNKGVTYQQIAAQGGGILHTVGETRRSSPKELLQLGQARADRFLKQGVTTLEIKSGYGLDEATEIKLLKVAHKIQKQRIVGTYLGAHAIPKDKSRAEYLKEMCTSTLPLIAKLKLASRVDMYIEKNYFDLDDAAIYFETAARLGLRGTAHVEQLSRMGGAHFLAAKSMMDSLDHCVEISANDIAELAKGSAVAMLLPAADFYLKMKYPPARSLIDAGARVALATDFNPGTSPTQDLSFVGVLARLEMKMSLAEVFCAYTVNAGAAVGLAGQVGALVAGHFADFLSTNADLEDFFYQVGLHPVSAVYRAGQQQIWAKS